MSRGMSVRTNFPLARSSPPTRATHDSVSALMASRPPSRSYSDFVCVVICFPLNRLVRPGPRLCPEGRLGLNQNHSADAPKLLGNVRADLPVRTNTPDVPQPGHITEATDPPAG